MASETYVRVEFMRFLKGQDLGPLQYEGDVLATCLEGTFEVGNERAIATALTQVVIPEGETLTLRCTSDQGAVQIVWTPPFAPPRTVR
jgi:hypothetical protein